MNWKNSLALKNHYILEFNIYFCNYSYISSQILLQFWIKHRQIHLCCFHCNFERENEEKLRSRSYIGIKSKFDKIFLSQYSRFTALIWSEFQLKSDFKIQLFSVVRSFCLPTRKVFILAQRESFISTSTHCFHFIFAQFKNMVVLSISIFFIKTTEENLLELGV